ncbi:MAG: hypothetical protein R3E32_22950, partial [Chitinophagales bacterium]
SLDSINVFFQAKKLSKAEQECSAFFGLSKNPQPNFLQKNHFPKTEAFIPKAEAYKPTTENPKAVLFFTLFFASELNTKHP